MRIRTTAIVLLSALIAPALITYCCLQYQRSMVKREIKWKMIGGINKEELVLIKLTKAESETKLRWEHSKEFEYESQMYDLVSSETKGDSIFYWCWWDHQETKLNKQLAELVVKALNADPQKREKQDRLDAYFKSLYCPDIFTWNSSLSNLEQLQPIIYLVTFDSVSSSPFTPPPELS